MKKIWKTIRTNADLQSIGNPSIPRQEDSEEEKIIVVDTLKRGNEVCRVTNS